MSNRNLLASAYMLGAGTIIQAFLVGYFGSSGIDPVATGIMHAGTFVFAGAAVVQLCRYLSGRQ